MGNVGDLAANFDPDTLNTAHTGTGSASTLPISDEERQQAEVNKRPIGFISDQHG